MLPEPLAAYQSAKTQESASETIENALHCDLLQSNGNIADLLDGSLRGAD